MPTASEQFEQVWTAPPGLIGKLRTINNIPVARRYMVTGFIFFLVGGAQALLMRVQLGTPDNTFLDAKTYNQLFTMHGTTMMFLFVIPFIEAVANYMLPLLLGTRDLPFPRLTALSYWTYVFGGVFLYSSFLFGLAPDGGWFAYLPLTSKEYSPGLNMDFWDIGLSVAEVAAMGAAAELIVAILRMRAAGMALHRLPLFAWAMLVTAFMIIFAFTPLIVGTAMLELDRKELTRFFDVDGGGDPLLWQHLFWVFGHPEVYIMFIPAVGIVSQVVQVFARRPIVGYTFMVLAMIATGFISFGLWVHHMFATGLPPAALGFFTAASMMIAIPNGVQIFGWLATLWYGRPVWRTPLLFVVGFIAIFVLGGITGVMVAAVPFDLQVHDSYFVVAHFHYVLIGGVVFPLFAGLYYWLPKITGRLLSETLGRWNFCVMFAGFNLAFFPMHISGLLGMPRRVYTFPSGLGWELYNLLSSIGAFAFAGGVLLFVANLFWSFRRGEAAGDDPWGADTMEWSVSSPPPQAQFPTLPVVRSRHPLWTQDSLDPADPDTERILAPLSFAPTRWRGGLVVSTLDARPLAIVHLPGPTIWPFIMSVAFVLLFAGALVDSVWLAGAGAMLTAISLAGWFWPRASQAIALEEAEADTGSGRLPLAVAGPLANGYWGTVVLILICATALVSLVASYFFLGAQYATWPPAPMGDLSRPLLATALAALSGAVAHWAVNSGRRKDAPAVRLALAASVLLVAGFLWVTIHDFAARDLSPRASAYASAVLGLLGYHWIVTAVTLTMLGTALLWAWLRPGDERGRGVVENAALMSYYTLASWLAVFATLFLTARQA